MDRDGIALRKSITGTGKSLQVVSASSSFLRLILSFRLSASRRAAVILACICSLLNSDAAMVLGESDSKERPRRKTQHRGERRSN